VVPPASHRISRVPRYSGSILLLSPSLTGLSPSPAALSNALQLGYRQILMSSTPALRRRPVWPLPFSLATTKEIEFSFFSSGYLDVSLPRVPSAKPIYSAAVTEHYLGRVPPFGYLRITAYLQLPEAFRSLSRPSSAISAMASTLRSYSLDLAILCPRTPKTSSCARKGLCSHTFPLCRLSVFRLSNVFLTLPVQFSRCVEAFSGPALPSPSSFEIPQNDTGTKGKLLPISSSTFR
jgi:hypothetical protein